MSIHSNAALIVFAKEPAPGQSKTRLAAGLPPACAFPREFAAGLYAACLRDLFHELASQPLPVRIFITPESAPAYFSRFACECIRPQVGKNLGERMRNAFMQSFSSYSKLLLAGSDMPQLRRATLSAACAALDENDCVLGPAHDGGYYLIGFTKGGFCDCFQGVDWSTGKVLGQTVERLAGKSVSFLECCRDLDTVDDLNALAASGQCPPQIAAYLREQGWPNF